MSAPRPDPMELLIENALRHAGIAFARPFRGLDFHLVDLGLFIEVKQFHSPRIADQMARELNIIVAQGRPAVEALAALIRTGCFRETPAREHIIAGSPACGGFSGEKADPMEEAIVLRRLGRNHEKPCRDPTTLTCALYECQEANECRRALPNPSPQGGGERPILELDAALSSEKKSDDQHEDRCQNDQCR